MTAFSPTPRPCPHWMCATGCERASGVEGKESNVATEECAVWWGVWPRNIFASSECRRLASTTCAAGMCKGGLKVAFAVRKGPPRRHGAAARARVCLMRGDCQPPPV
eukprot:COSAG01_NODE_1485_length_10131_cov_10.500995_8_plen_107_part_00